MVRVSFDENTGFDWALGLDVFMEVICTDKLMDDLKRVLFQSDAKFIVKNIKAHATSSSEKQGNEMSNENAKNDVIWFPMSIWDLDKCHHLHNHHHRIKRVKKQRLY